MSDTGKLPDLQSVSATQPNSDMNRMMRYDANKKSAGVAYVLWFFFGIFGAHRFYLGQNGTAAAILVLSILSFLLAFALVGFILMLVPAVWTVIDVFLIPGMVRDYNNKLISDLAP